MANVKINKSVKISTELLKKIEAKAKKEKRSPHYIMIELLKKGFNNK